MTWSDAESWTMSASARGSTRTSSALPSASFVSPVNGFVRTCARNAPSRASEPGETVSSAARAAAPEDAYQGSVSRRGYAESSTTECSIPGWRAMKSCTKYVP
jgi:hypothetical protein